MPNARRIGDLTMAGVVMGLGELVFCTSVLVFGVYRMGYGIDAIRTLAFILIVFGNQATTYNNRDRQRMWSSRPSNWLVASSVTDISIAAVLAITGVAMTPLPAVIVGGALGGAIVFAFLMDFVKVPVFRRLGIG
jgi:H+-transporting ATPase